jgi:hypothetical protein
MTPRERQSVIDRLVASEARIFDLIHGLTEEQWFFHESPERWSIAEIVEHLILFEAFIVGAIAKALAGAAEPEKRAAAAAKDGLVLGVATERDTKFNAREAARPAGNSTGTAGLIREFRAARTRTLAFVTDIQGDLRSHFFAHVAFGDLDCYQWLVLLGAHGFRHALQIEEIKADPEFPPE